MPHAKMYTAFACTGIITPWLWQLPALVGPCGCYNVLQTLFHAVKIDLSRFVNTFIRFGFFIDLYINLNINDKSTVVSYANFRDRSSQRGIDYNGRHISDSHTMHWKICYVHPQSGHTVFVDRLCQASGSCRHTHTDRQTDWQTHTHTDRYTGQNYWEQWLSSSISQQCETFRRLGSPTL